MTRLTAVAAFGFIACTAHAQSTPERTLGAPTVIGSETFRGIAAVRELSDGRVIVAERGPLNAMMRGMMAGIARAAGRGGRGGALDSALSQPEPAAARILLFDAKLESAQAIGHVGSGPLEFEQPERLVAAIADTTMLLDLGRSELLVIDPSGKFVASRAVPGGPSAMLGVGGVVVDRSGRIVFQPREQVSRNTSAGMEVGSPDSAALVAFDFKTGGTMPIAHVRVAGNSAIMASDSSKPGAIKMQMKTPPFPVIDDWVLMPDGTLAIIRGADLHIDWIAPSGKIRSTLPIAYARQEVTDSDKVKFKHQMQLTDSILTLPRNMLMVQLEPDSFPRFKPPFSTRGARPASDGTIWLPSKIISPAAAEGFAVIGPDGKVREIVHLAKGQQLLGFGRGVVYVGINEGRQQNKVGRVSLH